MIDVTTESLAMRAPDDLLASEPVQLTVVVPAYNEEEAIAEELRAIRRTLSDTDLSYEVLVVDDGSEDRTAEIARRVDGIRVIAHGRNRGYGTALKTGIRRAVGEIIVIIDADGQYPADEVPRLVDELQDSDMVVAARTGDSVHTPLIRRPVKWFLNKLAGYLAGTHIPDLNSGLRAFRRRDALAFLGFLPSGFSFTSTITLAMLCNDMLVKYVPINYKPRKGKSKIRAFHDTYNFILLVLRTICCFNPLKVFMPPAFLLGIAGLVKLGVEVVSYHDVADVSVLLLLSGLQLGAMGLLAEVMARVPSLPRGGDGQGRPTSV